MRYQILSTLFNPRFEVFEEWGLETDFTHSFNLLYNVFGSTNL